MRVLAIVHQPDAGAGVFADAILQRGAQLDNWLAPQDERPPRDPRDYDAVLTLGGAIHADQDGEHPWLAEEKALLADLLRRRMPLLGVCLGAQLIAEAAGARVRRARVPEIGWYQIETTDEALGDPLLAPLAPRFEALEWHSYEFPLPPGATQLARSAACLQAYRVRDTAWGIQFHAEVTLGDFESWVEDWRSDEDAVRLRVEPNQLRIRTRASIAAWNELGRGICERFLTVAATASSR